MPTLYVKNNGTWKEVKEMWVKKDGVWNNPTSAYIKDGGTLKNFYPSQKLLAVTTPSYYNYTFISGQGGTGNGNEVISGPAPAKEDGGFRTGDRYFPVDGTYATAFTNYCYPFTASDTSGLTTFRSLITGTYNAMFSSVSAITTVGGVTSFTAVLNTGYHFNMVDAVGNVRVLANPGTTYTFAITSTQTGVWGGSTPVYYTGTQYFYGYQSQGTVWKNTTNLAGDAYVTINVSGVSKVCNVRIRIDNGLGGASDIVYTSTQGERTSTFSGTLGPYSVPVGGSIQVSHYWWGTGNFSNSSYISSGTWQVGTKVARWYE
jgi:hypothetical protein